MVLASIPIISLIMHWDVFPKELVSIHVWRQVQTQTTINNFYEEDFNILNPRLNTRGDDDGIVRLEFPIMQWSFAGVYKLFGKHLIITRILSFLIGLLSVFGMYFLLHWLFDNPVVGVCGAWAFNFSPIFYYYTVNPMPDNLALCFGIWGLATFIAYLANNKPVTLLVSALLLSLGTLTKLPFVIFFAVPFFYFLFNIKSYNQKQLVMIIILFALVLIMPLSWYLWVIPGWGTEGGVVTGVLGNQLDITTIFYYIQHNLISTLPELLLNYAAVPFFIAAFYFLWRNRVSTNLIFKAFALTGFALIAYFFFEINVISTVHDYYLFPFMPVLFILVAYGAYQLMGSDKPYLTYVVYILLLTLPLTAYLRMKDRWNMESPGFNKDFLVYKNELRDLVPKDALCVAGNDHTKVIYFYYVDKKGWGYDNYLTGDALEEMIQKGAQYIYCDDRKTDQNPAIRQYFDEKLFDKGSIRVYSLKPNPTQ